MNKIKDALMKFLGDDYHIEEDFDGSVVSGLNATVFIVVIAPCQETSNYWAVNIYPRVSVDRGDSAMHIEHLFISEDKVVEYLGTNRLQIFELLLAILTKECVKLHDALEDRDYLEVLK